LTAAVESSAGRFEGDSSSEPVEKAGAPAPEPDNAAAPTTKSATFLSEIDNFPDAVFDICFGNGISTLETLKERMGEELPALEHLPTVNKLVAFFVKLGAKIGPAKHAANAVADHIAKPTAAEPRFVVEAGDELVEEDDGEGGAVEQHQEVWHVVDTTKTVLYERYIDEYRTEADARAAVERYEREAKSAATEPAKEAKPKGAKK
jgi:hypothetical protein